MSQVPLTPPSTLEGIKKRAKKLKKNRPGISHTAALEAAAREMGYATYALARKDLADDPRLPRRPNESDSPEGA